MKNCSKCSEAKSLDNFHKNKASRDGYQTYCKPCGQLYRNVYRMNKYRKGRNWEAVQKYGLKTTDYERMLKNQSGRCWICKSDSPGHNHNFFSIDHCHTTGQIRGLLCNACNMGLGYFRDSIDRLAVASKYLQHFTKITEEKAG